MERNVKGIVQRLTKTLSNRFSEVLLKSASSSCVCKYLKVLHIKSWPSVKEDLTKFGLKELNHVMNHFQVSCKIKLSQKRLKAKGFS